ncbi:MAG TPA: N-acetyltransferase [Longimicrobiaceae bacterium]|nr:N-acetyltransferase [Longimicrobiaceae bacterium]
MLTENVEAPPSWSGGPLLAPEAPSRAQVRVRGARVADMQQLEPLINGFAARELMLPKTIEQLSRNFREFVVAEAGDGRVLGCAALRVYTPQLAELGSLAVHGDAHGVGVGRRLVERIEEEARALGIGTVFALTLQDAFFHKVGYRTVQKEMFPLKVWADCRQCPKIHACDEIAVVKEVL